MRGSTYHFPTVQQPLRLIRSKPPFSCLITCEFIANSRKWTETDRKCLSHSLASNLRAVEASVPPLSPA
jgi:hypothetical protein